MNHLERVKLLLSNPKKFFAGLKKEKGVGMAFKYFAILSLINVLFGFIILLIFQSVLPVSSFGKAYSMGIGMFMFFMMIFLYVVGLGISFVAAGILHVWIIIFGGKSSYEKTYQLYVYQNVPSFLFGWLPYVGYGAYIYSLILLIIGTPQVHKQISLKKSILMYLIPLAVFLLFVLFFFGIVFLLISGFSTSALVGQAMGMGMMN
jgi:hypothetical protein